jgi:hypothetical protein
MFILEYFFKIIILKEILILADYIFEYLYPKILKNFLFSRFLLFSSIHIHQYHQLIFRISHYLINQYLHFQYLIPKVFVAYLIFMF